MFCAFTRSQIKQVLYGTWKMQEVISVWMEIIKDHKNDYFKSIKARNTLMEIMLVLTSLWKQLLDCIANQSWKHQESLFRSCGKSKLFECVCLKSGFSSIWLLCCLKYCYFFKIYILLFLFPSAFFFQNSKIKFPLPHRIIKSHYKSKFVAKRPNTFYWKPVENDENPVETMKSDTGKLQ